MDIRKIAKLALAEDTARSARSVGGAEASSSPSDPEFESKHPRSGGGRFSQKFSNFANPDILPEVPSSDPDAEYADVVARYSNPDGSKKPGWMKAPDGTPTLLTERQWVQVRTPSFKRWFGDWENDPAHASKVVSPNGEPMVVYRGSPVKMGATFEYGRNFYGGNLGFWFTTSESAARDYSFNDDTGEYGEVKSVFLNARDPMDLLPLVRNTTGRAFCDFIRDAYGYNLGRGSLRLFRTSELYRKHQASLYPGVHDGIRLSDVGITWIVKIPTQIKSATDNTGAFSPEAVSTLDSAPAPFDRRAFARYLAVGENK